LFWEKGANKIGQYIKLGDHVKNNFTPPYLSFTKVNKLAVLTLLSLFIIGCNSNSTTNKSAYIKKEQNIMLESEPKSYRKYALVSSGNLKVEGKLTTDGPLGDVHVNGNVKARALSLDISGKISASNDFSGSIVRSFDYSSPLNEEFVNIRALKVSEYLNTASLDEYYLLTNDGKALHKIKDKNDTELDNDSIAVDFSDNTWRISGTEAKFDAPLVVEGDLNIETDYLFVAGTLMVSGNLKADGELNINTGTPFEKALIVDKAIEVDKLTIIGRVHGSSTFTSHSEVNILGNAEIDGDVTLYGDAKINFLDNTYKAALYEAQEEANDANDSMMLVHSQLFSNAKGKNSVVLFTFVEGDYLMTEKTIFKLIKSGELDDNETEQFKFKSYLYGATIDYGAQLQKFDGLSPYYYNKLELQNKLVKEGHTRLKIKESIDIAPSNLYHTYEDADSGVVLGTYLIYSVSTPFDINNTKLLSQEERENNIYAIEHKNEIDIEQEEEAKKQSAEQLEVQKQEIIDSTETNLTTKSEQLAELEEIEQNSIENTQALKEETSTDRVQEWVEYRDLTSEVQDVDVQEVVVDEAVNTRGWWSRFKKRVKRFFRKITFTDCKKKTSYDTIWGVSSSYTHTSSDTWASQISINNEGANYCTPISAAMIINYHKIRKNRGLTYKTDYETRSKGKNIDLVKKLAAKFKTGINSGTAWYRLFYTVPREIKKELRKNRIYGYTSTWPSTALNRWHQFRSIKRYIRRNNPVMFSATQSHGSIDGKSTKNHSMPVIGYKYQYYKGSCWKRVMPNKNWILVDSTWQSSRSSRWRYSRLKKRWNRYYYNSRGYLRFDSRSNYWKIGAVTYVRAY